MTLKVKTVAAEEPTYDAFRQLAKEYQLSNPELLAAMVQYFRVTKADPREPTGPDLTASLAKLTAKLAELDKRTIGFIREQEKTYLKPILAEVQAHKVLSSPAPSAPAGLSDAQARELGGWFLRVLLLGVRPDLLSPAAVASEPQLSAAIKGAEQDPTLNNMKGELIKVLRLALPAENITPRLRDIALPKSS